MAHKEKNQIVTVKWASAVIVAAGTGVRMDGIDKILCPVGSDETPLIALTLAAFEDCALIREVIVVTRSEIIPEIDVIRKNYGFEKVTRIVTGGVNRTESVRIGLAEINKEADYVAIHDGARPLVTPKLISEVIFAATENGAAIAAEPVTDTVKHVMGGWIKRTVPRKTLYAAQTPQVFDVGLIKGALHEAVQKKLTVTDDSEAVEALGIPVRIVDGGRANIKVTYPEDIIAVNAYLDLADNEI